VPKRHDSEIFKRILVDFVGEEDPLMSMLQWTTDQLMQIESEIKVGAPKGTHICRPGVIIEPRS